MPDYKLFCRDGGGRFSPAQWIRADSDATAIATARRLHPSSRCEVWEGQRLVAVVMPEIAHT